MPGQIVIVPYDANWPRRFEEERAVLASVFAGSGAVVEHIGSTSVPGLGAKPVIDVMVGVVALSDVEGRMPALEDAGYEYVQKYEAQLPERRYFRKPRTGSRAFHVHCVVKGSEFWVRHLAFRDYLREHPASAAAYDELKRDLAARVTKADYTDAKSPFIESVLTAAMREAPDDART